MFASGVSPRAIARRLNEEGVPGPEGRLWQDTTIRGQKERGTGLFNNELYIGEMVWNRCSYVKDPRTGKRVARPEPGRAMGADARCRTCASSPTSSGTPSNAARRRHLRDGQMRPGCLQPGSSSPLPALRPAHLRLLWRRLYHHGQGPLRLLRSSLQGIVPNDRTITRQEIEGRILKAIKQNLLTPELVAEFTRAYTQEINRLVAEASKRCRGLSGKLTAVQRKIDGIMRAIEDGMYQPSMKSA